VRGQRDGAGAAFGSLVVFAVAEQEKAMSLQLNSCMIKTRLTGNKLANDVRAYAQSPTPISSSAGSTSV
jgi:hypothetical protein